MLAPKEKYPEKLSAVTLYQEIFLLARRIDNNVMLAFPGLVWGGFLPKRWQHPKNVMQKGRRDRIKGLRSICLECARNGF